MSLCKSNSNVATTMCKKLSDGQQDAFDKYKKRCNVFITGPGGSGKSELIRHIYNDANLSKKKNTGMRNDWVCVDIAWVWREDYTLVGRYRNM